MFCWAFSIRDLESNESLIWREDILYSTCSILYICTAAYAWVCVRMVLIAICEHEKLYVGEVKRSNSMHVIHLNNQPMQWTITHCKHLDTLGKILNYNQCLYCCKYKEENPPTRFAMGGKWKRSIAHNGRMEGTGGQTVKTAFFWRYDWKMPAFSKCLMAFTRRRFTSYWRSQIGLFWSPVRATHTAVYLFAPTAQSAFKALS